MSINFRISAGSASEIARMAGFSERLKRYLRAAMTEATTILSGDASAGAPFLSGALHDSIHPIVSSPTHGEVVSDLPYSRRREYGFSGMTDSLGRYFANDPGRFYMTDALAGNAAEIEQDFEYAIMRALQP